MSDLKDPGCGHECGQLKCREVSEVEPSGALYDLSSWMLKSLHDSTKTSSNIQFTFGINQEVGRCQ